MTPEILVPPCFSRSDGVGAGQPDSPDAIPVLVVEDDPGSGAFSCALLRRTTSRVSLRSAARGTRNGRRAVARGGCHRQVLPACMAPDCAEAAAGAGLGAPVIIMSARDDLGGEIDPAGADGHLLKPFPLNLLLSTLGALPRRSPREGRSRGDLTLPEHRLVVDGGRDDGGRQRHRVCRASKDRAARQGVPGTAGAAAPAAWTMTTKGTVRAPACNPGWARGISRFRSRRRGLPRPTSERRPLDR